MLKVILRRTNALIHPARTHLARMVRHFVLSATISGIAASRLRTTGSRLNLSAASGLLQCDGILGGRLFVLEVFRKHQRGAARQGFELQVGIRSD